MHITTTPTPTAKPCIRDYSELVTTVVPEAFAKLVPLEELQRRLSEVAREKPHLAEETPLYLKNETRRRAAFEGAHLR
ncbi:hypothetical protein [Hymenobacter metallicola]|uniref:Uncharacterized protein n=1 Tax=Hymenobacter metallicola TaxID=2563114 RepID=A0A4Z0QJL7_9BACT|nr:hypothetical protein [Hymenobacter metallicola]TGE29706.1 hypothetical protein E5K02_09685 [Hymenobacter metallicola]